MFDGRPDLVVETAVDDRVAKGGAHGRAVGQYERQHVPLFQKRAAVQVEVAHLYCGVVNEKGNPLRRRCVSRPCAD